MTCRFLSLSFIVLLLVTGSVPAQTVKFDRAAYSLSPNRILNAHIEIDPVPPAGLFSYGIAVEIVGNDGILGAVRVEPVDELNFDGSLGSGADSAQGDGSAAAKGTINFFDLTVAGFTGAKLGTAQIAGLPSGAYTLHLHPLFTLGPKEQLFVSGDGSVLESGLTFGTATLTVVDEQFAATAVALGQPALDRQRGVATQTVRLTNTGFSTPGAFRIIIGGLPADVRVWNSHGTLPDGRPYIQYEQPLGPGEHADLLIEYHGSGVTAALSPQLAVSEAQVLTPVTEGELVTISPRLRVSDGSCLLEFDSADDRLYWVQYSDNLQNWKTAQPAVIGTGGRIQWFDTGPPRTSSKPLTGGSRYYRLLRVAQ